MHRVRPDNDVEERCERARLQRHAIADQFERHPFGMPRERILGKRKHIALDRGGDALAAGRVERIVGEHLVSEAHAQTPRRVIDREREPRELGLDGRVVLVGLSATRDSAEAQAKLA